MINIEDTVDLNIYRHNGFRLLDLPITASGKKVKKIFRKIEAKYKISDTENIVIKKDMLMPIEPVPKFNSYQRANSKLNDAKIRFIHEIFWFWPSNLIKDEDTDAWEYLRNKQYDDFIKYWENKNDNNVSYHNLAIFYQAISLDFYALNDNNNKFIEYSKKALHYWKKTFSSGFENFAKDRVRKLNNPLLKESFVNEVFSELQKVILSIYLDITKNEIKLNNLNEIPTYIDLINDSGFNHEVISNSINSLLTFLISQIDSKIKDYETVIKDLEKTDYLHYVLNLKSYTITIYPLLDILSVFGSNNIKAKDTINNAYAFVINNSVTPFNSLLKDKKIFHNLNLLYVSLLQVITDNYNDLDISYNLKQLYYDNSQITKDRINYLKTYVYSQSDYSIISIMNSYLNDEFNNGAKLDNINKTIDLIVNSGASKVISDVCMEILYDSLNYCLNDKDKVTQILYRQNLNILKYEMVL